VAPLVSVSSSPPPPPSSSSPSTPPSSKSALSFRSWSEVVKNM
jgi:hypothetical protein